MQELTEIESPSAHTCETPEVERWRVYEPVSMRWSWLNVYQCCNQVFEDLEAVDQVHGERGQVQKAA